MRPNIRRAVVITIWNQEEPLLMHGRLGGWFEDIPKDTENEHLAEDEP
jgi:hypothetical protein